MVSISIDDELERINNLITTLDKLNSKVTSLQFVSIKQFCEASGWSEKTVQDLYNRPDFPSTNFGKEKIAELHAIVDYFKVPRRKGR